MALITVKVNRQRSWRPSDRVQLVIGDENAASLAASTDGGRVVQEQTPWPDGGAIRGGWGRGRWGAFRWGLGPALGWGASGSAWGAGEWGWSLRPRLTLEHAYRASDKCATLPIGVRVVDEAGNIGDVLETVVQLQDPPQGARNFRVVATGQPGEAKLTWTESADLAA